MGGVLLEFGPGFPYLVAAYLVCYGLIAGYGLSLLVRRAALRRQGARETRGGGGEPSRSET